MDDKEWREDMHRKVFEYEAKLANSPNPNLTRLSLLTGYSEEYLIELGGVDEDDE